MFRPLSTKSRKQRSTKVPASYRGSRTGNSANNLELKVLTHIQYVP
ncbi:uncharacterized protein LOC135949886 [Calliphora vicina]